jgi:hypothetical protein
MILNIRHVLRMAMGTILYSQMHRPSHLGRFSTPALQKCQKLATAPLLNGVFANSIVNGIVKGA